MRLANVEGRLAVLRDDRAIDVATASNGRFGPDPQEIYPVWDDFLAWADIASLPAGEPLDAGALGPVVPRPRQIFAVGLNYVDHTIESGFIQPAEPMIFTKFASCLTGPRGDVVVPSDTVDFEVELVAVIGRTARSVDAADGWDFVAGLTIGQDISDRGLQMRGDPPQFSLGKSHPGFGPVGPCLTTLDQVGDRDNLSLTSAINGEVVQRGHTRDMVFPVLVLVSYLSAVCTLFPGDLIFTGTPPGVGMGRTPPRYLVPGDVLETEIGGLGEMRHTLIAPA
ncbi:fumarylacetoacetate hydrolase [Micromonospora sonchi]|uniref:Fumarylacetoacetate hydrolase n=1 Tax=Micromonospora sonchi TaxID=1763543 RepID=A0A917U8H1_9ACTN|nr:fumarylacetoacetate hydrolase family protein [Micromonospora sonchi]GGM65932.1 fumarylacetoacetate hydrolase [Micromonospora sonchi]